MPEKREQRWRERQERWVAPADRPLFDPAGFEVRPVAEGPAREFVEAHHYSGSYVASRVRAGVFDPHGELVGVAVFSVGMNPRTLPSYFGPGVPGVELGRFVLTDELGYNAETWVLRRAFAQLRRELPEVQAVLAFSDPVPRKTWLGDVVTPGHVGTIYKAFGGRLLGRSEPRTRYLDILGREVSLRGLGKIRGPRSEREFAREVERLVAAGAPDPLRGEDPGEWVRRALASGAFTAIKHPGNLAYAWSVAGKEWAVPTVRHRDLLAAPAGRGRGAIKELRALNPPLASLLDEYRKGPSLEGWWELRTKLLRQGDVLGRTVWKAIGHLAWFEQTGEKEEPPFAWAVSAPETYPESLGAHPAPARVEQAIRFALGLPAIGLAGVGGTGPMRGSGVEVPPTALPFDPPSFEIPLYHGKGKGAEFWESGGDIGLTVLLHRRGGTSHWSVFAGQGGPGRLELLTERVDAYSTTTWTIGGRTAEEAVERLARLGLRVRLDSSRRWVFRGKNRAVLTSTGRATLDGRGARRGRRNVGDLVGWRVARYARRGQKEEAISGADSRLRWPLHIGAVHTAPRAGFFVSPSREYVLDHYAVHDHNVLLKYRFREADIRRGNPEDREPELGVARATLVGWWPFTDEEPPWRPEDR